MAESAPKELRIYCICGQKMRVSAKMFGKPGKCVACRQKIRIPTPKELPDESAEIYLKDHPEFLRQYSPEPAHSLAELIGPEGDAEALSLGELPAEGAHVPLDPLPPLQHLCSYDHKLQRQFDQMRNSRSGKAGALDKSTLMSYRALLRNARANLDEKMRHRLHELTEQLDNTHEQIARALLAIRIGEKDYADFLRAVLPLRQRRERLERRRQNLLGWLATTDPYLAGGYVEVELADVPCEKVEVSFSLEAPRAGSLLHLGIEGLRQALEMREATEKKLDEWGRMEKEGALTGAALSECRADTEALRKRSRASVAFYRSRLEQIVQDCESDINALKAYMEVLRGRSAIRDEQHGAENLHLTELMQAQSDNMKARDLAARAIHANTAADVPRSRDTFMNRMARPTLLQGIGLDSWIAWAAAALMMLSIMAPISNAQIDGNKVLMGGMVIGLFSFAVTLVTVASIPRRDVRGLFIASLWIIATLAAMAYLHHLRLSIGAVGAALRSDPGWYHRPGMLLLYGASILMGGATAVSLFPLPKLRWCFPAALLLLGGGAALILTDYATLLKAKPYFEEPVISRVESTDPHYEVIITLGNRGGRSFWVGDRLTAQLPNPVMFFLEQQLGPESWKDLGIPHSMQSNTNNAWTPLNGDTFPRLNLASQEKLALRYHLAPGVYRVQVRGLRNKAPLLEQRFALTPLNSPPPAKDSEVAPSPPSAPPGPQSEVPEENLAQTFSIQLRGVMDSDNRAPRFPVTITDAEGFSRKTNLALGDVIVGDWKAAEFSPTQNTLTISNGQQMLVLQPGEVLELSVEPPAPEQ